MEVKTAGKVANTPPQTGPSVLARYTAVVMTNPAKMARINFWVELYFMGGSLLLEWVFAEINVIAMVVPTTKEIEAGRRFVVTPNSVKIIESPNHMLRLPVRQTSMDATFGSLILERYR